MNGKKLFISSTCYDLVDLRAELYELTRGSGFVPVMSDISTSEFDINTAKDSIETCLINVKNSDIYMMILSQRYGQTFEEFGYGKYSVTHLEYKAATENSIPRLVYVRDKLMGVYELWKSQERPDDFKNNWTKEPAIFRLMDEHMQINPGDTNWFKIFRSSVDLKEMVAKDLSVLRPDVILERLIESNMIPLLWVGYTGSFSSGTQPEMGLKITNHGATSAFGIQVSIPDAGGEASIAEPLMPDTPATCKIRMTSFDRGRKYDVKLRYTTFNGYRVEDEFKLRIGYPSEYIGKRLLEKKEVVLKHDPSEGR